MADDRAHRAVTGQAPPRSHALRRAAVPPSPTGRPDEGNPHRWSIMAVLGAVAFMAQLDFFIVNVALAGIGRSFPGATDAALSWVLTAYAIPNPVRAVYVAPIKDVSIFKLPNQVVTDLHAQLDDLVLVSTSPPNTQFQPVGQNYLQGPDGTSVEIRPVAEW